MKTALQSFADKDLGIDSPEKLRAAGRRVIYRSENGTGVTAKHFLKLCNNDEKIAFRLFNLCEWQCPETLLDEDRNEQDPRNVCFPCVCGWN